MLFSLFYDIQPPIGRMMSVRGRCAGQMGETAGGQEASQARGSENVQRSQVAENVVFGRSEPLPLLLV